MRIMEAPAAHHLLIELMDKTGRLRMMLTEYPERPDGLIGLRRIRSQAEEVARLSDQMVIAAVCQEDRE